MTFKELYKLLENSKNSDEAESKFFIKFYTIPQNKRTPEITAYMTISNWFSNSLRSGVWTYYEIADYYDMKVTSQYLKDTDETEMESVFSSGIHDYQNPEYAENFNYPTEWIEESEQIDNWILKNQNKIYDWLINLLLKNKSFICSLDS